MSGVASAWRQAIALLGLVVRLLLPLGLMNAAGSASAHEMSMAEMQVREMAPGEFACQWMATEKRPAGDVLSVVWPDGCRADGATLHCGSEGLQGRLTVDGVGKGFSAAMIKVFWRDGQSRVYTLTGSQPSVNLYGAADDPRGMGEIASAYTLLGIEHILSGIDHLLFVISLLLLVGYHRQLLWTITAFTAAHSLTLASSALGWLTLRSPPVEACIALSIVLVAIECLHDRQTLSRRWPALVAFLFGLVHGLGFAGALQEIGLPPQHMLLALLTFNVGVEIGQLMTVGAAWLVWRGVRQWSQLPVARRAVVYGIGSVASFWVWQRVALMLAS